MTQHHPDLAVEQEFIDFAHRCLDRARSMRGRCEAYEGTLGGTFQARYERDVFDEAVFNRLTQLDLGDAALVFGRIDRLPIPDSQHPDAVESFHIGRLAVADENADPVVVDWRAPVAEPFYRATGRDPLGLARRRHFHVRGCELLGLEDELFGDGHLGIGAEDGIATATTMTDRADGLRGYSTLLAVLERGRTGQLGDIVATIQGEQDEIIRSPQAGVGGRVVLARARPSLHRTARPICCTRSGSRWKIKVSVIGPNPCSCATSNGCCHRSAKPESNRWCSPILSTTCNGRGYAIDTPDTPMAARVKGDLADEPRHRQGRYRSRAGIARR